MFSVVFIEHGFNWDIKAGFQHADFSASADFYARADFSVYPHVNFHHNADCLIRPLFCKDLDKTKIAITSNINVR